MLGLASGHSGYSASEWIWLIFFQYCMLWSVLNAEPTPHAITLRMLLRFLKLNPCWIALLVRLRMVRQWRSTKVGVRHLFSALLERPAPERTSVTTFSENQQNGYCFLLIFGRCFQLHRHLTTRVFIRFSHMRWFLNSSWGVESENVFKNWFSTTGSVLSNF